MPTTTTIGVTTIIFAHTETASYNMPDNISPFFTCFYLNFYSFCLFDYLPNRTTPESIYGMQFELFRYSKWGIHLVFKDFLHFIGFGSFHQWLSRCLFSLYPFYQIWIIPELFLIQMKRVACNYTYV